MINRGYASDTANMDRNGYMSRGTLNAMVDGVDNVRPFRGLTEAPAGPTGSRFYALVDGSYAGLGEFSADTNISGSEEGQGSIFKAFDLLLYIGSGKLKVKGYGGNAPIPTGSVLQASNTLSYIRRHSAGEFINSTSGIVDSVYGQVGHTIPSKPTALVKSPPSAGKKSMNAAVMIAVWRVCSITGQTSSMSEASDVITAANGSVLAIVPEADSNNQDKWGFGGTRLGLQALGNIYQLPTDIGGEVFESTLYSSKTIASGSITTATKIFTSAVATGGFHFGDIGKRLYIQGKVNSLIVRIISGDSVEVADNATATATSESTLVTTSRWVQAGSITTATKNFTAPAGTGLFSAASVGQRISIPGKLDSYIATIVTADSVTTFDNATATATAEPTRISPAVSGVLRAVELAWSDDDLQGQDLAPTNAFPPPTGRFAGGLFDVVWIEDMEGTILYSLPGYLGSFPRSRRILTDEKAVVYLEENEGSMWRISKQSIGIISYVGGDFPIEYEVRLKSIGCQHPQNASIGMGSNVLLFHNNPVRITDNTVDSTFFSGLERDFTPYLAQTEDKPVVTAYDPKGHYEMWCWERTVMSFHVPTQRWCSPVDITPYVPLNAKIVGKVIINERLHLSVDTGAAIKHYEWDAGTGSTMTIVTTNSTIDAESAIITQVNADIETDQDLTTVMNFYIIKNSKDSAPLLIGTYAPSTDPILQETDSFRPNIRGVKRVGVKIQVTDADEGVDIRSISVYGDVSGVIE